MNAYELRRLKEQLYIRIPLIGRLLQRQAARSLARHETPRAMEILAETLGMHPDPNVQKIAQQAIERVTRPSAIDAICQVWARTRQAWLGKWIQQRGWVASTPSEIRVLSALQANHLDVLEEAGADLVSWLVQACNDGDPQIAQRAFECLHHLHRPAAINAFCSLWVEQRSPQLEKILLEAGYIAHRPVEVRLLSALKQGQLEIARRIRTPTLPALLRAAEDRDPLIASRSRQALSELKRSEVRSALCQIFIEQGLPLAGEITMQAGFLPADQFQRALFYFFTQQWAEYQALDFEQRVLRSTYETASPALRQRILEKIRLSGQASLLQAISGRMVVVEDIAEADALARLFIEHQEWERAWAKAFEFPFSASLQLLRALAGQGWQPSGADEQAALAELTSLVQTELEISPEELWKQLPAGVLRARVNLLAGRINAVAFAPHQPVLAVGASTRKAVVWDFQRGQRTELLRGFAHSIGQVAYSADGQLLVAERTNGRIACAVYVQRGENAVPVWQCAGPVTALEAKPNQDYDSPVQMISTGRDGRVVLLELGSPIRVSASRQLADWPRTAHPSPDGKRLVVLHSCIELLSLPDLRSENPFPSVYYLGGIARHATFTPDGQGLVVGKNSGWVEWRPISQTNLPPQPIARHPQTIQGLETLKRHQMIVSADAAGNIRFTRWADRQIPGKIIQPNASEPGQSGSKTRTTSLHISPDESFMALGHADAHLSLWDLRPLDVPDLLSKPLAHSTPNQLAALDLVQNLPSLTEKSRRSLAVLLRLLRHRFRFDIEVSEVASIQAGEYDIEIE
jgi:WD40 repeat protein/HEAT repeat protein